MPLQSYGLGVGLLLPMLAFAQEAKPVSAMASVNIMAKPMSASQVGELTGEVVAGNQDREVVIDPSQALAAGKRGARAVRPASYDVSGRKSATFALTLPTGEGITLNAAGATLAVKQFRVSVDGGPATANAGGLTFTKGRPQNFKVGATLLVGAGQPRRAYQGNFNVTLAYN